MSRPQPTLKHKDIGNARTPAPCRAARTFSGPCSLPAALGCPPDCSALFTTVLYGALFVLDAACTLGEPLGDTPPQPRAVPLAHYRARAPSQQPWAARRTVPCHLPQHTALFVSDAACPSPVACCCYSATRRVNTNSRLQHTGHIRNSTT